MRKIFLAVCLVAILLLAGCREPLSNGTIMNKRYVPTHLEDDYFPAGDKVDWIKKTVPDRWFVQVRNDDLDRTEWIGVSKEGYERAKIGDFYKKEKK